MNARVNISLECGLLKRLDDACEQLGISRSKFVRKASELLLRDIEDPETLDYVKAS